MLTKNIKLIIFDNSESIGAENDLFGQKEIKILSISNSKINFNFRLTLQKNNIY